MSAVRIHDIEEPPFDEDAAAKALREAEDYLDLSDVWFRLCEPLPEFSAARLRLKDIFDSRLKQVGLLLS